MTGQTAEAVEQVLREELDRGDAILATARPVLRLLLGCDDYGLFGDETVARIRGMIDHLAWQLLFVLAEAADAPDRAAYIDSRRDELARALLEDSALLAHAQALTIEAQLAERLQARSGIDGVLTPLLQELMGRQDSDTAALAMDVLAAQARFVQHHRRMELPLGELPADLFHRALTSLGALAGVAASEAEAADRRLRDGFDEASTRLGLLARLVVAMGPDAARALAIGHAGLAVFTTALGGAANMHRDLVALSFVDRQFARLALALRAAGLEQQAVEEQVLVLNPDAALPVGFDTIDVDAAAALLAASQAGQAL